MATIKKGKPELRRKVYPAVEIQQRKSFQGKDGMFLYFEDDSGVTVNNKGKMKSSANTGPVAKSVQICGPGLHPMQAALHDYPVYL
jgi:large subunit ribosomal protein L23e